MLSFGKMYCVYTGSHSMMDCTVLVLFCHGCHAVLLCCSLGTKCKQCGLEHLVRGQCVKLRNAPVCSTYLYSVQQGSVLGAHFKGYDCSAVNALYAVVGLNCSLLKRQTSWHTANYPTCKFMWPLLMWWCHSCSFAYSVRLLDGQEGTPCCAAQRALHLIYLTLNLMRVSLYISKFSTHPMQYVLYNPILRTAGL